MRYTSYGFTNRITSNLTYNYGTPFNWRRPAFSLAEKEADGRKIVVIIVRGSVSLSDWIGNADIRLDNNNHSGFMNAQGAVYEELIKLIGNLSANNNTTFFITGHSLGGATSNLLAKRLIDEGISTSHVFAYTFATPRVTKNSGATLTQSKYDSIFNIINRPDPVTLLPGTSWGRYGIDITFTLYADTNNTFADPNWADHDSWHYYGFMQRRNTPSNGHLGGDATRPTRPDLTSLIGWNPTRVLCPVDVYIYDSNGILLAQFINNQPQFINNGEDKLLLHAVGDEKYIIPRAEDQFTLRLVPNDSGIMEFTVETFDSLTGQIIAQKTFTDVTLSIGRQMTSTIGGSIETHAIRLLLTINGQIIGEIFEDGTYTIFSQDNPPSHNVPQTGITNQMNLPITLAILGLVFISMAEVYRRFNKKSEKNCAKRK